MFRTTHKSLCVGYFEKYRNRHEYSIKVRDRVDDDEMVGCMGGVARGGSARI